MKFLALGLLIAAAGLAQDRQAPGVDPNSFILASGDSLFIQVFRQPNFSRNVRVAQDGKIALPGNQEVRAAGLTPNQLADKITQVLSLQLTDPRVSVTVTQVNPNGGERVAAAAGAAAQAKANQRREVLALAQERAALLARMQAAIQDLERLRQTYTDSHPDVQNLRKQIEDLRAAEAALQARQSGLEAQSQRRQQYRPFSLQTPGVPAPDRWWRRPSTVQSLGLTPEQQTKMDDVFQQFRLQLIDANAALQKAEATLDPLVSVELLDDSKIVAQIDRIAEARAALEKINGRMLLGIRKLLTPAQWAKLNASMAAANGSVLEQALK